MINRVLCVVLLIVIVTAVFFKIQSGNRLLRAINAENENITLKSKINGYENEISKYNRSQERSGETIQKVRTIIRNVKNDCDCYNTIVDERVRDEIRRRRKDH